MTYFQVCAGNVGAVVGGDAGAVVGADAPFGDVGVAVGPPDDGALVKRHCPCTTTRAADSSRSHCSATTVEPFDPVVP